MYSIFIPNHRGAWMHLVTTASIKEAERAMRLGHLVILALEPDWNLPFHGA